MNAVNTAVRIILQIALLLAWAMPVVAAMTVWNWLFDWRRGVVNWMLTSSGFDFQQPQLAAESAVASSSSRWSSWSG